MHSSLSLAVTLFFSSCQGQGRHCRDIANLLLIDYFDGFTIPAPFRTGKVLPRISDIPYGSLWLTSVDFDGLVLSEPEEGLPRSPKEYPVQ